MIPRYTAKIQAAVSFRPAARGRERRNQAPAPEPQREPTACPKPAASCQDSELPAAGRRVRCIDNSLVENHLVVGEVYTVLFENTYYQNYQLVGISALNFSKRRFEFEEGEE